MRCVVLLAATVMLLSEPPPVAAQRRPLVVAPEFAGSLESIDGGPRWGYSVETFTARLTLQARGALSPWVASGRVRLNSSCARSVPGQVCIGDGWLLLAGLRGDLIDRATLVRPYVVAGVGALLPDDGSAAFVPSLGAGLRWALFVPLEPRVELRWERYASRNFAIAGVGLGLAFGGAPSTTHR